LGKNRRSKRWGSGGKETKKLECKFEGLLSSANMLAILAAVWSI
jgi:hypothetical protein